MTDDDRRAELRALITRAGVIEAQRLLAVERGDRDAARHCEHELARLWKRYCDLEHESAIVGA